MENNWLKLMNLLKEVLILKEIVYQLMNKKILNELVEQRSSGFIDLEKKLILTIWFISIKMKE